MPTIQDSRMTEDAKDAVEEFFISVANNNNEEVREFLELEPTLIYARDENGSTAIHCLIVMGRPADLATLRAILEVAQQNNVLPDYRLPDNDGHNAYQMLQVHAGQELNIEFAAAIGIHVTTRITNSVYTEEEYEDLQRTADEYFRDLNTRDTLQRENAYFNGNPNHRLIEQMGGGAKIYTALIDETYSNSMKDLFAGNKLLTNFDDEKKFNQMNAEVDAFLKSVSFAPKTSFLLSSLESDSLIIIPQEISDIFGKIYDYFLGNSDHQ